MQVDSTSVAGSSVQQSNRTMDSIESGRRNRVQEQPDPGSQGGTADIQPEELLGQIKALTEDGLYSVRFEKNQDSNEFVVKVVDTETDEVIRQVPPEEILDMHTRLEELRGNIVSTTR